MSAPAVALRTDVAPMTSLYLAGSSADIDVCSAYITRARAAGLSITHDWTAVIRELGDANPTNAAEADRLRWALDDLHGVDTADIFWLLMPARAPSIGCWVEFGVALRSLRLKRSILSGAGVMATVFSVLADYRYAEHEEAFRAIVQVAR